MVDLRGGFPELVVRCSCGHCFENVEAYLWHKKTCPHHQEGYASTTTSDSIKSSVNVPFVSFLSKSLQKPVKCQYGRMAKGKQAAKHLPRSGPGHKAATTWTEQPGGSCVPMSSTLLASGSVPDNILLSGLSEVSLICCTCGRDFETQEVLDRHKRNSLYHKQQINRATTGKKQNTQWDDTLSMAFESLNLKSELTSIGPSNARISCECGRSFASKKALGQHERDTKRLACQEKGGRGNKAAKASRQKYQEDKCLQELAAVHARQKYDREE